MINELKFGRFVYEIELIVSFPEENDEYIICCNDKNGNNILGEKGAILCKGLDELTSVVKSVRETLNGISKKNKKYVGLIN
jgi:hypothetical protein